LEGNGFTDSAACAGNDRPHPRELQIHNPPSIYIGAPATRIGADTTGNTHPHNQECRMPA
jgi:hypothetical protein